ncbi:MAG: phosphonate C-P lyase system protein PhnH [Chloroflexaceae bacterium]|nr:phosphonate C-P lyase system protein PhnH [Chloroflexaceae bacterium]
MLPLLTEPEKQAHASFIALMQALSYPGRPQRLPAAGQPAFVAIGEALVDLETSYHAPDPELAAAIARTGGRQRPVHEAHYQFYPQLHPAELDSLARAPVGSYLYPDESATLVLGCTLGSGQRLRLSGPGINGAVDVQVGGLPEAFWSLRAETVRYPLGWDIFLVAGDQVLGLPRTTVVEQL